MHSFLDLVRRVRRTELLFFVGTALVLLCVFNADISIRFILGALAIVTYFVCCVELMLQRNARSGSGDPSE